MTEVSSEESSPSQVSTGRTRRRLIAVAGVTAAAGTIMVLSAAGTASTAGAVPQGKVTYCSFVGEDTWETVVVDKHLIINGKNQGPNDIIPQFIFRASGGPRVSLAKNMDTDFGGVTGREIFNNGCVIPEATPTPTETVTAPATETETATETQTATETAVETVTATTTDNAGGEVVVTGPIPAGVAAGLHNPVENAGLKAWGIVLMVLGGAAGLLAGMWPSRRRAH